MDELTRVNSKENVELPGTNKREVVGEKRGATEGVSKGMVEAGSGVRDQLAKHALSCFSDAIAHAWQQAALPRFFAKKSSPRPDAKWRLTLPAGSLCHWFGRSKRWWDCPEFGEEEKRNLL